jgi:Flp pilus assembly protein TadD
MERLRVCFDKRWARLLCLAVLGLVVRLPALQGEPIWDDAFLVRDNPLIKSPVLLFETFRHYLHLDATASHYRPVQNISYMLDYFVWHTNWYGFHLSSLCWHVSSGLLLCLLLERIIRGAINASPNPGESSQLTAALRASADPAAIVAFSVALLWLVHPVHSAAVDYISGRADSLAFFFACGGWLLYLAGRERRRIPARVACYLLASASLLLALCSRESACMWLIVFLLFLFVFDKKTRLNAKCWIAAVCIAILAIYGGLRHLPAQSTAADAPSESTIAMRSTLMLRALGDYGRLMIFPTNLHMERTVVDAQQTSSPGGWRRGIGAEYLSICGLIVAAGLVYGSVRKGPARRCRAFGAAWFILAYLPVSNLIELNATVAEHWLYLPSVGFLIFLAGCFAELPDRARKYSVALVCCFAAALSARSYVRSSDWVSAETFYQRTIAAGGTSVRVALNLGYIYSVRGDVARAEQLFRRILRVSPDFLLAQNNLGDALHRQGKIEEAQAIFAAAKKAAEQQRQAAPRTWIAALNMAQQFVKKGDADTALVALRAARADYPGTWELVALEAEILRKNNGAEAAMPIVTEFATERWWHAAAWAALGRLRVETGDLDGAESALWHASSLDVHDAESLSMIARTQLARNRVADACAAQRRAVAREPDDPRQHVFLSEILTRMGRTEEARASLARANQLQALGKLAVATK